MRMVAENKIMSYVRDLLGPKHLTLSRILIEQKNTAMITTKTHNTRFLEGNDAIFAISEANKFVPHEKLDNIMTG